MLSKSRSSIASIVPTTDEQYSEVEYSYQSNMSQDSSDSICNFHLYNTDPWLAVLLGAFQDLPLGLALHEVTSEADKAVNPNKPEFPYVYVNPYYASHCGGFAVDEIKGKAHSYMYLSHDQKFRNEGYKSRPVENSDTVRPFSEEIPESMKYSSILNESDEEKLWTERNVAQLSRDNSGSMHSSRRSSRLADDSDVESMHDEMFDFGYCHQNNSLHLNKALKARHSLTVSIPMRDKCCTDDNISGYVNVLAWKPIVGYVEKAPDQILKERNISKKLRQRSLSIKDKRKFEDLMTKLECSSESEVKYYMCLQVAVPVADINLGLRSEEVEFVQTWMGRCSRLIDYIPDKLLYEHSMLHFCN